MITPGLINMIAAFKYGFNYLLTVPVIDEYDHADMMLYIIATGMTLASFITIYKMRLYDDEIISYIYWFSKFHDRDDICQYISDGCKIVPVGNELEDYTLEISHKYPLLFAGTFEEVNLHKEWRRTTRSNIVEERSFNDVW